MVLELSHRNGALKPRGAVSARSPFFRSLKPAIPFPQAKAHLERSLRMKSLLWPLALLCFLGCDPEPSEEITEYVYCEVESPGVRELNENDAVFPLDRWERWMLGTRVEHMVMPNVLNMAGIHSRKEMMALTDRIFDAASAYEDPNEMPAQIAHAVRAAYLLLGFYGSIQDAHRIFQAVQHYRLDLDREAQDNESDWHRFRMRSLGYFLMRDHLKPQPDRELMAQIEDYLNACSHSIESSCWTQSHDHFAYTMDYSNALYALAYGNSAYVNQKCARDLERTDDPNYRLYAQKANAILACVNQNREFYTALLPPVMDEAEIDQYDPLLDVDWSKRPIIH